MMGAGSTCSLSSPQPQEVRTSSARFIRLILSPIWFPNTAHHLAGGGDYVEEEEVA